jgi:hypothetical protein
MKYFNFGVYLSPVWCRTERRVNGVSYITVFYREKLLVRNYKCVENVLLWNIFGPKGDEVSEEFWI